MTPQALPFDEIRVGQGDHAQSMSVAAFLALPLPDRVEHILRRDVSFFLKGKLVERREALNGLRMLSASSSKA